MLNRLLRETWTKVMTPIARLFLRLGISTDVVRLNENFRRNNFRELRDGQSNQRDKANDDHDDGNHHGDDRTIDEKFGHNYS